MRASRVKLRRFVALIAVMAIVVAACGDDDNGNGNGVDPVDPPDNGAVENPGEGVTVQMARADWNTGFFQAAIFQSLLEELGYEVTDPSATELGPDLFYPQLAEGELDFWANGWIPLHNPQLEIELPDGSVVGDLVQPIGFQVEAGAVQGFLVDRATADEYGIETLDQILADDELRALFDTTGDGRAELAGCNEGWGCAAHINSMIEQNGWEDVLDHVQGEYSLLFTDAVARQGQGEPVLYYTWTPNFTVAILEPGEDVVWIGVEADSTLPDEDGVAELDEGQCAADPCIMGFTPADIRVVANNAFLDANPAARALFEAVEIPAADIFAQNLAMDEGADTQSDIDAAAAGWIADNRDLVDGWLDAARAAA